MKAIKIFFLKRKVKSTYLKIKRIEARYDCGAEMIKYACAEYHPLCLKLDEHLAKLNKLDPKCPPARNVNK